MTLWPDLTRRRLLPELMDDPGLDAAEHRRALRGLQRINRLSRSASIVWPALRALAARQPNRALTILDVASGGGDVAIAVWHKARRAGLRVEIMGVDVSPLAVEEASRAAHAARAEVRFQLGNALAGSLPGRFDVVMSSLFLHHLEQAQAVALLCTMASASERLVLVNDLCRSLPGYLLAHAACRAVSRSPVVHVDGPRSVAGAFSMGEVEDLCRQAGLESARIERRWPFRFLLCWQAVTPSGSGQFVPPDQVGR